MAGTYKREQVVWVTYRKQQRWPAKIKCIYSKKITYVFFPLEEREIVFRTNGEGAISPFDSYEPPNDAKDDLLAAYDAAKRFLKGEIVEKIPTVRSSGERVPLKTPKKQKLQNSHEGVMSKGLLFKPGDAVIVDTTVGMWPALLREISLDQHLATYLLFPRDDPQNKDHCQSNIESLHPFPRAELETMINERGSEEGSLLKALLDVKDYYKELESQISQTMTPKKSISKKERNISIKSSPSKRRTPQPTRQTQKDKTSAKRSRTEVAPDDQIHSPIEIKKKRESVRKPHKDDNLGTEKKCSLLELAISEDAKGYMNSIWTEAFKDRRILMEHKKSLNANLDLTLNFKNGSLFNVAEVEKMISEVTHWITLCPSLPKMSELKQMQYIANFVLPLLSSFAISKERSCSILEARGIYDGISGSNQEIAEDTNVEDTSMQKMRIDLTHFV